MIVYNYTKAKRREKRLYSLFNTTISRTGIVTKTIYTCLVLIAIFFLPGIIVCNLTGNFWYNPLTIMQTSNAAYFWMIFIAGPIALGVFINNYKIQNYKIIDYLKMYFTPKAPLDIRGKKIKIHGFKIKSFIEKL